MTAQTSIIAPTGTAPSTPLLPAHPLPPADDAPATPPYLCRACSTRDPIRGARPTTHGGNGCRVCRAVTRAAGRTYAETFRAAMREAEGLSFAERARVQARAARKAFVAQQRYYAGEGYAWAKGQAA